MQNELFFRRKVTDPLLCFLENGSHYNKLQCVNNRCCCQYVFGKLLKIPPGEMLYLTTVVAVTPGSR